MSVAADVLSFVVRGGCSWLSFMARHKMTKLVCPVDIRFGSRFSGTRCLLTAGAFVVGQRSFVFRGLGERKKSSISQLY